MEITLNVQVPNKCCRLSYCRLQKLLVQYPVLQTFPFTSFAKWVQNGCLDIIYISIISSWLAALVYNTVWKISIILQSGPSLILQWPHTTLVRFISLGKCSLPWPTFLTWYSGSQVPNSTARCPVLFYFIYQDLVLELAFLRTVLCALWEEKKQQPWSKSFICFPLLCPHHIIFPDS